MSYKFTPRQAELIDDMKSGWKLEQVSLPCKNKPPETRWELRDVSKEGVVKQSKNVSANTVKSLLKLKVLIRYPSSDRDRWYYYISQSQITELNKSKHRAHWSASLHVDCPKCKDYVDLLDDPDFWEGRNALEICQHDTEYTNNMDVVCPNCGHYFEVCCEY